MNELEAVKEQIDSLAASSKKQQEEITLLREETEIKQEKIKELKKVKKKLVDKTVELKTLYKDQWGEKINEFEREISQKNNVCEDYRIEIEKLEDNIVKLNATKHMYNTYRETHNDRKDDQLKIYDKVQLDIVNYGLAQKSKEGGDHNHGSVPTKYENPKKFLDYLYNT